MEGSRASLVILIAHYNNLNGLIASLQSIRENFDIDLVIVDDGSVEQPNIKQLKNFYKNGEIYLINLPENKGVGVAANAGLAFIQEKKYPYISRLDCGDTCYEGKFEIQLDYLKKHPDVMLLGTWVNVVSESGEVLYILKHPITYEEIRKQIYLNSTFVNPTVVFRSEVLAKVKGYAYKYRHAAQDYAFFFEIIKHYKAENLPQVLLNYEISANSISSTKRRLQVKNRLRIILENFKWRPIVIYSLIRNGILYFLPRNILEQTKKYLIRR